MKWIDSTDLISWANRRDCQETLPLLVRKLIRATTNNIQSIKFPAGESVLYGGWDGILDVLEETEYLPAGISLWEFGASKDPKGKADDDYAKRVANPLTLTHFFEHSPISGSQNPTQFIPEFPTFTTS